MSSHRITTLGGLLLLCVLSACASATIRANRDTTFTGRLTSFDVFVAHPGENEDAQLMSEAVVDELQKAGVRARGSVVAASTDLAAIQQDGQTDALLFVRAANATQQWYGETVEVGYDVTLVPAASPTRRIWKAQLSHSGDGFMTGTRIRKAAAKLVAKLREDRLL